MGGITEALTIKTEQLCNHDCPEGQSQTPHPLQAEMWRRLDSMSNQERLNLQESVATAAFNAGLRIEETPVPLIQAPIIFDQEKMAASVRDAHHVHQAMLKIEQLAFSNHPLGIKILDQVTQHMFPEGVKMMMMARNVRPETSRRRILRMDTFTNPATGAISLIETNCIATEGIHFHDIIQMAGREYLARLGIQSPEIDHQATHSASFWAFQSLVDEYTERHGRVPKRVAIIYEPEGPDNVINRTELPYLQETFSKHAQTAGLAIEFVLGRPADIDAGDGRISIHGQDIDVIWRNNLEPMQYRGIANVNGNGQNVDGFLHVVANPDKHVILNDERARFPGYKLMMALMHDHAVQKAASLTPDEVESIKRFVPLTFDPSLTPQIHIDGQPTDVQTFLNQHRDRFVLKPSFGTHGNGVVFGNNPDNESFNWAEVVKEAIDSGKYIAQQLIPYEGITMNIPVIDEQGHLQEQTYYMDTNLHIMGGGPTGTYICRASSVDRFKGKTEVLNVAAGGGLRPGFTV